MEPLVSIITPVYNSEEYLEETILSVINQTYKNWELLLIDDCSTDGSYKIIEKYLVDERMKYFKNKKNSGPAITRNIGLNETKGEYIALLDSDDFWKKDKLKNQVEFMIKNNLNLSHGNYYFCNLKGEIIKNIKVTEKINYKTLLKENQFKTMTMMIKKEILENVRFQNIKHEDFAFFLDILKKIDFSLADIDKDDSFCRIGKISVSSNKLKSAIWTWNIYRKYEKLNLIQSVYYFGNYVYRGLRKYK